MTLWPWKSNGSRFHLRNIYKSTNSAYDRVRVAGGMISIEGSMKFEEIKGNSGKQSKSASVKKRRKDIVQNEVEGEKTRATKKKKSKHTKQSKS